MTKRYRSFQAMKVFRAEPTRVVSFTPGRGDAVLSCPGHLPRRAELSEVLRANDVRRAPVERFSPRFLATMRAKGWLRGE